MDINRSRSDLSKPKRYTLRVQVFIGAKENKQTDQTLALLIYKITLLVHHEQEKLSK